jgi:PAS domain S-box-containing protein
VIDASASSIAILDENSTILFINRTWRQFATRTGSLIDQFGIGDNYPGICMGTAATSIADAAAIKAGIRAVIEKRESEFQMEYQCTALTEPVWFRLHAEGFLLAESDSPTWVMMVSHDDITSEILAKTSLIEERERLEHLWGTANILPWEAEAATGTFTAVGHHAEAMLGYPIGSWFRPNFWIDHMHSEDREMAITLGTALTRTEDEYQFECRMIAKDGQIVSINNIVSVHRENGEPVKLSGFMVDITERKQAENTLQLLSGRLITAQEEERKRIARDLHDDLNQRMALLSIELEQVGQMIGANNGEMAQRIKDVQLKAVEISTEIHRMSYRLHPAKLDHLGLMPALKGFCEELSKSRGVNIKFQHEGFPADLPTNITLCIFRIAQEGLQNAVKHSGSVDMKVSLIKSDKDLALMISDEGCGFDMSSEKMRKGLGFISMRERLRLVEGQLKVQSNPSKGTQINISIPLNKTVTLQPVI